MESVLRRSILRRVWSATWRIAAFFFVFALCTAPLALALSRMAPADGGTLSPRSQALFDGAGLIAILAASAIMLAKDRRPFNELGLATKGSALYLTLGALLGLAMIAMAAGGLMLGGLAQLDAAGLADRVGLPLAALSGLCNVLTQDLLIAGYAYAVLASLFGPRSATISLSLLFVGLHAGALVGGGAAVPALNLFLAGVLLISCRAVTGSLWLTVGVHFAWNFIQGPVLGLAVTGKSLTANSPVLTMSGPTWVTGGAFGLEGGFAATGATASGLALVWLAWFALKRRAEGLRGSHFGAPE